MGVVTRSGLPRWIMSNVPSPVPPTDNPDQSGGLSFASCLNRVVLCFKNPVAHRFEIFWVPFWRQTFATGQR